MFGISVEKLFIITLIAVLVIGPSRLPEHAAKYPRLIREVRRMANGAQEQLKEQLGPDLQDVDWRKMDPRRYDPRRIIREALLSDDDPSIAQHPHAPMAAEQTGTPTTVSVSAPRERPGLRPGQRPPFDLDAT